MAENKAGKTVEEQHSPASSIPDKSWFERLGAWIWAPAPEEGLIKSFLRALLRVVIIVFQEFLKDKIPLRASALTFIVFLSMVPMLALGTAVLKGLGAGGEMRQAAHTFITQFESTAESVDQNAIQPEPEPSLPEPYYSEILPEEEFTNFPAPPTPEDKIITPSSPHMPESVGQTSDSTLTGHLERAVNLVFDYVDKTNFAALGAIGILVLLLAVFTVLDSIEDTMNEIWQTGKGRSPGRKLMDYLALMLLLPITINLGLATMATLQSEKLLALLHQWAPWVGPQLLNLLPILALVATFTILYSFLPNTKVTFAAALIGGIFGGLVWLFVQSLYFKMQIGVVRYNAIYGSFATLPLFLIWIHVSWMVFLAGAEVSFAVQVWRRYLWNKMTLSPIGRLALAFEILAVTGSDFQQQKITTRDSLVWTIKQPDAYIKELLDLLCLAKVLRHVEDEGGGYVPSSPLSEVNVLQIGEMVLGELPDNITLDNPAAAVLQAAKKTLSTRKISARRTCHDS